MSLRRVTVIVIALALVAFFAEEHLGPWRPAAMEPAVEEPLRVAFLGRLLRNNGTGGCVSPGEVRDRDVVRNAHLITNSGLCITRKTFTENGSEWRFTSIAHPKARGGPVWYLPHDNESEAFDAAVYAVSRYGGRLVAVDGGEGRNYRGIDPNRTFALTANDARPCAIRRAAPQYTRYVMSLFDGARVILSMHNNSRGGGVTVNVNDGKSTGFRTGGTFSDPDHMVFIAGRGDIKSNRRALATRDKLLRAGLNVVYENVSEGNSDCSFSNHVVLHDRREYFNIEAVHGSRVQKGMVDALMGVLGYGAAG